MFVQSRKEYFELTAYNQFLATQNCDVLVQIQKLQEERDNLLENNKKKAKHKKNNA